MMMMMMTFEISVVIFFFSLSLLLFPEHGDIQNVSYTAQRQTDLSLQKLYLYFITSLSHVAIKLRQFLKIFIQHTVVTQIRKEKMLQITNLTET